MIGRPTPQQLVRLHLLLQVAKAKLYYISRTNSWLFAVPLTVDHVGQMPYECINNRSREYTSIGRSVGKH